MTTTALRSAKSFDVIKISWPDDLGDIANPGLTLADGKRLLLEMACAAERNRKPA